MHSKRSRGIALDESVVGAAERRAGVRSRRQRLKHLQLGEQAHLCACVHERCLHAFAANQDVTAPHRTKSNTDEPVDTTDWNAANTFEREPGSAILRGARLKPQGDADALGGHFEHP